jgi:predicted nucleic acid-binding protein
LALTFVDAGVLIAAARGTDWISRQAILILNDPRKSFAASPFLRLEILPKAVFHKKIDEVAFYSAFFAAVEHWAEPGPALALTAESLASRFGLAALDALHVAAALSVGAEEIYTTERREKPIHRVTEIRVRSIHPG